VAHQVWIPPSFLFLPLPYFSLALQSTTKRSTTLLSRRAHRHPSAQTRTAEPTHRPRPQPNHHHPLTTNSRLHQMPHQNHKTQQRALTKARSVFKSNAVGDGRTQAAHKAAFLAAAQVRRRRLCAAPVFLTARSGVVCGVWINQRWCWC